MLKVDEATGITNGTLGNVTFASDSLSPQLIGQISAKTPSGTVDAIGAVVSTTVHLANVPPAFTKVFNAGLDIGAFTSLRPGVTLDAAIDSAVKRLKLTEAPDPVSAYIKAFAQSQNVRHTDKVGGVKVYLNAAGVAVLAVNRGPTLNNYGKIGDVATMHFVDAKGNDTSGESQISNGALSASTDGVGMTVSF